VINFDLTVRQISGYEPPLARPFPSIPGEPFPGDSFRRDSSESTTAAAVAGAAVSVVAAAGESMKSLLPRGSRGSESSTSAAAAAAVAAAPVVPVPGSGLSASTAAAVNGLLDAGAAAALAGLDRVDVTPQATVTPGLHARGAEQGQGGVVAAMAASGERVKPTPRARWHWAYNKIVHQLNVSSSHRK